MHREKREIGGVVWCGVGWGEAGGGERELPIEMHTVGVKALRCTVFRVFFTGAAGKRYVKHQHEKERENSREKQRNEHRFTGREDRTRCGVKSKDKTF
jgi:hypothetical protein